MKRIKSLLSAVGMSLASVILLAAPASAAGTVAISGNTAAGENQSGWLFNRDVSTSTPYEFNTNEHSLGSGSLYVLPITNLNQDGNPEPKDKFIAENFLLTPIADVDTISFDYMIGNGGDEADSSQFYMNVYANFDYSTETKFYDCRYNIVPTTNGSTTNFTTVTFNPELEYAVDTRTGDDPSPLQCPPSPADMGEGAFIRMYSINVGDTNNNDAGLDGYLDNVVVALEGDTTTYDFEAPVNHVDSKDECKNDGWKVGTANKQFKNQGDCISHFASDGRANGNPVVNFFKSIFNR